MKAKIKNLISINNYQRAKGKLKISFMNSNDETSIHDLYQSGALKVLIPKSKSKYAEAVLINIWGNLVFLILVGVAGFKVSSHKSVSYFTK